MEIGRAVVDITPPENIWRHISLGGYSRMKKCQGVRDRIFARILYISPDSTPSSESYMIMSIDQVGIPHVLSHEIRETIQKRWKVPLSNIYIYATHNHYTPEIQGLMPAPTFPMIFSPVSLTRIYINYLKAKIFHAIPGCLKT